MRTEGESKDSVLRRERIKVQMVKLQEAGPDIKSKIQTELQSTGELRSIYFPGIR